MAAPVSVRKGARLDIAPYRVNTDKDIPGIRECAEAGMLEYIAIQLLMGHEEDVTKTEDYGRRGAAMHYAAKNGHLLVMDFLVEHGASVNALTGDVGPSAATSTTLLDGTVVALGQTPLMWLAQNTSAAAPVLDALISRGADVTAKDRLGHTALTYALHNPTIAHLLHVRGCPVQPGDLIYAASKGYRTGALYLLENHPTVIDIDYVDPAHGTALHAAVASDSLAVIKVLLCSKCSTSLADTGGYKAADIPSATRQAKALVKNGCKNHEPSHSNLNNLLKKEKITRFLAAALVPNVALVVAALFLPAVFGFAVLILNLFGVQLATKTTAKSKSPEPSLAGWYSGALFFGSAILATVVFPEIDAPNLKITWYVVTTLMFMCYVRAVTCDPGVVVPTQHDRQDFFKAIEAGGTELPEYCPTTLCRKPLRAKFCSTSRKLIHRFDHYCVWTSNSIGAGNHRPFFFFTLFQCVSQSIVMYFAILFTRTGTMPGSGLCSILDYLFSPKFSIVTYFLLFYNAAVMVFIGLVFGIQSWYISRNVTSNEVWFPDRYQWCFNLGRRTYTLFDNGFAANWRSFLFGDLRGSGYSIPVLEHNKHLSSVLAKFQSKQSRAGAMDHSQGGSQKRRCCKHHDEPSPQPLPPPPPPQPVDKVAEHVVPVAEPAKPKVAVKSGNMVDEESGLTVPMQLRDHIMKLPLETRKKMALQQQQEFARHNIMNTKTGEVKLPSKSDQDAFLAATKEKQQNSQLYVVPQRPQEPQPAASPLPPVSSPSATASSERQQDIPAALLRSSSQRRTTAQLRSSTQNRVDE